VDLASFHRTAEFVWRIVERCGKEPGGAEPRSRASMVSQVATILMQCSVNVHSIQDPSTQRAIGYGLYPAGAMLNHDCSLKCDFLPGVDGELRFVTTRRVGRGEDRVISDHHFRKTATEYDRKPGIKWLRCTAK
jgi:hypothetical protein